MSQPSLQIYEFDTFRVDPGRRMLSRAGEVVPLKAKDFALLLALVEHSGRVLDKDELLKRVWPDAMVEEGNLSVHIFALRRALGETPEDHRYIVTMPGRGYLFAAAVRTVECQCRARYSKRALLGAGWRGCAARFAVLPGARD